eukprot:6213138-Pleurochrysis_carterae.AAC.8
MSHENNHQRCERWARDACEPIFRAALLRRLLGPPNARKPALSLGGHSGGGHGVGVTGGGAGLVTNGLDAHETAAELLRQPAVSSAVAIALWQLLAEQARAPHTLQLHRATESMSRSPSYRLLLSRMGSEFEFTPACTRIFP